MLHVDQRCAATPAGTMLQTPPLVSERETASNTAVTCRPSNAVTFGCVSSTIAAAKSLRHSTNAPRGLPKISLSKKVFGNENLSFVLSSIDSRLRSKCKCPVEPITSTKESVIVGNVLG